VNQFVEIKLEAHAKKFFFFEKRSKIEIALETLKIENGKKSPALS